MKAFTVSVFTILLIASIVFISQSNSAYAVNGDSITQVASLEHDVAQGQGNSFVQVDSDTFALAYSGPDNDGFIKTFDISADGLTITPGITLEHDVLRGEYNSLVQVDSDTYALAYAGQDSDGYIKTFDISSDGSSIAPVFTLEHDTANGLYNSFVQVDSDTFALAYSGEDTDGDAPQTLDGFIKTFTISADGLTITEEESLEHDTIRGFHNSLVQVDSDTFALAYAGPDTGANGPDGFIKTFTISADGLTITEEESLEYDTMQGFHNSLVQVDSDTYALAYASVGNDAFIKTFTIPSDGLTITQVQSLNHDSLGQGNSLVQVDSNTYALAYAGDGGTFDGFIKTFTIPSDGLTITQVQSLEHDGEQGTYNSFVQVDSDTYALAYAGDGGTDGYIKTFTITATLYSTGGGGSDQAHKTRPTFGLDHKTWAQLVTDGFQFNSFTKTIDDNFHTDYPVQDVRVGQSNTFTAKIYADKGLRVQEFLFGLPEIGKMNAEVTVEVWYGYDGEIDKVIVIQDSNIISVESIIASHSESYCKPADIQKNCDSTKLVATFREPLQYDVMAIKAIDWKGRTQTTFLNEGFNIFGDSLNPMITKQIPGTEKHEGLITITQLVKFSDTWLSDDGRIFEELTNMDNVFKLVFKPELQESAKPLNQVESNGEILNQLGSSKFWITEAGNIYRSTELFGFNVEYSYTLVYVPQGDKVDTDSISDRYHTAFDNWKTLQSNKAKYVIFNSDKIQSELSSSFAYEYPEIDGRTQFLIDHNLLNHARG